MGRLMGLFVLISWFSVFVSAQDVSLRKKFTVVSYNVENLFDTINDPKIPDEEFLPISEKKWDSAKYQKKLDDLARVITEINPLDMPEIVGLVEVENRSVLVDLVTKTSLQKHKYSIIHEESPDYRGIDVALIYRQGEFTEIMHEPLPVVFADDPEFKTRDILHVIGKIRNKTVHIFVNHWPSRIGGEDKTEPKRIMAASVLKQRIDVLLKADPKALIVVMGDMNDEPANKSLLETLGAKTSASGSSLVNLMFPDKQSGFGTYFYSGNWNMLDNILVSKEMIVGNTVKIENQKGNIHSKDWMIFTNKNGDKTPNRSYVGPRYTGGVSDHFPVYFKMIVK